MEDRLTLMNVFEVLARPWRLNMSTLRRGISTLLVSVLVMCLTLATPGRACAALSSSLTGAIDVVSGNVTIQGKTDAEALVVINGRQFRASAAGTFSASFPPGWNGDDRRGGYESGRILDAAEPPRYPVGCQACAPCYNLQL